MKNTLEWKYWREITNADDETLPRFVISELAKMSHAESWMMSHVYTCFTGRKNFLLFYSFFSCFVVFLNSKVCEMSHYLYSIDFVKRKCFVFFVWISFAYVFLIIDLESYNIYSLSIFVKLFCLFKLLRTWILNDG